MSSIKEDFSILEDNSTWLLGNGEKINFWNDSWCGAPLSQALNIPQAISSHLSSTVSDYIVNGEWSIPADLTHMFQSLRQLVQQAIIPLRPKEDELLWKHSANGLLNLKHAYVFKRNNIEEMKWTKLIWNKDIPPSKSLMIRRLMQEKIPGDKRLMERGCQFASMCSLCFKSSESSLHLFFSCSYAQKLWSWISATLNINIQFGSMDDIWKYCDRPWSPQCKIKILAAVINLFNSIWFVRNESRFSNKLIHWKSAISDIISNTSLTGNLTNKASNNSICDFTVLKLFNVNIHRLKAPTITEVIWRSPLYHWIKCNSDGASLGNPGVSSCGGIFRDFEGTCVG